MLRNASSRRVQRGTRGQATTHRIDDHDEVERVQEAEIKAMRRWPACGRLAYGNKDLLRLLSWQR